MIPILTVVEDRWPCHHMGRKGAKRANHILQNGMTTRCFLLFPGTWLYLHWTPNMQLPAIQVQSKSHLSISSQEVEGRGENVCYLQQRQLDMRGWGQAKLDQQSTQNMNLKLSEFAPECKYMSLHLHQWLFHRGVARLQKAKHESRIEAREIWSLHSQCKSK